ncbi:MAG: S41 family peptidase [Alphaproteobacteria bacterium]|nr:S41 family peptidase [Alphaproteobacteria bacterium]
MIKKLILSLGVVATMFVLPVTSFAEDDRMAGKSHNSVDVDETYRQLDLFGEVFERTRNEYVEEVEDKELIKNALNGMLSSLDPHSAFLDEDDFADMRVQTRGEFGGLGIEVTMENGFVKVVSPIDDTPAYKAGVEAGDFVTHLDGESVLGMTLSDAVDVMRGRVGTSIELTVRREGESEALEIKIIRDVIRIRSVRSRVEDDNIGYIRITTFNQNTQEGLEKAFKDIKKEADGALLGYVLDLRNNPGGLLTQAISVSDTFLDKGEIVSTRGRKAKSSKRDNATPGDLAEGLPMVVLVNGGSASASEIVAGALQDHRRAVIMGTQSFGKGSVQTVIPLPQHGAAMRITTARYFTPSGQSIQAKGITPDIVVKQAKIEEEKETGRLKEADLKGALSNPNKKGSKKGSKKDEKEKSKAKDDYQLSRAIDLLKGLSLYSNDNRASSRDEQEVAKKSMEK